MIVTTAQWEAVRAALAEGSTEFATLLTSAPKPRQRATEDWSVTKTAAHVVVVARLAQHLLTPTAAPDLVAGLESRIATSNVDTIAELNELMLNRYDERDPQVLAKRLQAAVERLLADTADRDPSAPVEWIGGARLPAAGVLAHLLNEVLIHGYDIARACGAPWRIPPERSALFLELFLYGLTKLGYGNLLDHGVPAPERRITVQFRSRHTTPATLLLTDGRISLAAPDRRDDVRVRFDPTTLILMMFGRVGKARALLTGKVSVAGRRPWLLPSFLAFMHLPGRGDPSIIQPEP